MKKLIMALAMVLLTTLQANAVLKEKDLSHTIQVLKLELRNNHIKQRMLMERIEKRQEMQHAQLLEYMQRSEQIGLMLYSQKTDFTFDIAYACEQAHMLYRELSKTNIPYNNIRTMILTEVARYDSLLFILEQLPPAIGSAKMSLNKVDSALLSISDTVCIMHEHDEAHKHEHTTNDEIYILSEQEQKDREQCIIHAKSLRNNLLRILKSITKDQKYYEHVSQKVQHLDEYAQMRYARLQDEIFSKGSNNYFKTLSSFSNTWMRIKQDVSDKYFSLNEQHFSQWRGSQILFVSFAMIFYLIIASVISNVILRWAVPARYRTENYIQKRPAYIMTLGILIFTIAMVTIMQVFKDNGPVQMASKLMTNMTWLMQAIMLSLLIRLSGKQMKHGVRMYMPFMAMAFIVMEFRILLIPNNLINFIFPPILLLFTIWQIAVAKKNRSQVPMSDKFYSSISLFTIVCSLIASWSGYTLMAVQVIIWWTFQLAAIQTITCVYDLMEMYENKILLKRIRKKFFGDCEEEVTDEHIIERMHKGDYITTTWFYDLVNRALVPICGVLSVIFSILYAADTFEMRATCETIFFANILDVTNVVQLSIHSLCLVVGNYFLFRFLNYAIKAFYFNYKRSNTDENSDFNKTLAKNIIAIIVWGIYIIYSMKLLDIPDSGIKVVSAGLATGMGFAMKDLLENFFYGISLMAGRVRVGDYIECDGIFGKVESITYQSTQIVSLDGSIIAFLNSSLFSKNFKNLTRNHQYELIKIPVGVAYGSDINKVRELILEGLKPLATKTEDGRDIVDPNVPVKVMFSDFGASSVDLFVVQWLLVDQKNIYQAKAKEIIYNILNENNIEIPFPQQDIYIRQIVSEKNSTKEDK